MFSKFLFGGEGLQPGIFEVRAWLLNGCRLRLKCDDTRSETRFRLPAKRTSPFKSVGTSVHSTTGSRGVRISGSNAGYTMFRGSVKSTGYPHHSPVSPSLPLPCVTVCHHVSTGLYHRLSCYSSVGILRRPRSGRPRNQGSIAIRGKRVFSYMKDVNRQWWSPRLVLIVYRG